jgi:hypothetical protein
LIQKLLLINYWQNFQKNIYQKKNNIAEAENYFIIDKDFDELSEVELDVDRGLQPNLL